MDFKFFNSFLDSSPMAVVTANKDGVIVSASASCRDLMGRDPSELVGQPITALVDDEDFEAMFAGDIQTLLATVVELQRIPEITVNRRDGGGDRIVDILFNQWELDGETVYTAVYQDLTERIEVERTKHEFISTVSHELRTPLTSIHGALGLIGSGAMGEIPEEAQELLDIAYDNCERLTRLINDILDVEKIGRSDFVFDKKVLPVDDLLKQAVSATQSYAEKCNVKLAFESQNPEISCEVDKDRLLQVMDNLISNACKFSPADSNVVIGASATDTEVTISVTDNGPGIPEEFQDALFERFTQVDSSDTKQRAGTGLGLNIVKMIVEGHGGVVSFTTEVGEGSVFYVTLPRVQHQAVSSPVETNSVAKVLICEDDQDIARLIQLTLAQRGIAADIALDAATTKAKLASGQYTVLTLDLMLPDQYGLDLLADVREEEYGKDLSVVVVSAVADRINTTPNSESLAISHVMAKPINTAELLDVVSTSLDAISNEVSSILHVEDDLDIRRIVSSTLDSNYDLTGVGTLGEAKQYIAKYKYDLILLDMSLPDGSAEVLIPLITELQPQAKMLVFSALNTPESVNEKVAGALVKAKVSVQELADHVNTLIEQKGKD